VAVLAVVQLLMLCGGGVAGIVWYRSNQEAARHERLETLALQVPTPGFFRPGGIYFDKYSPKVDVSFDGRCTGGAQKCLSDLTSELLMWLSGGLNIKDSSHDEVERTLTGSGRLKRQFDGHSVSVLLTCSRFEGTSPVTCGLLATLELTDD
jgi:hypothetical protein